MHTLIYIADQALSVEYTALEGQPCDHWAPEECADLILDGVSINGSNDISELLADNVIEHILNKIRAELRSTEQSDAEDYYSGLAEQRKIDNL